MKKFVDQIVRVCYPANLYMVLQYLLITNAADYNRTFWFFDDYIPLEFDKNFKYIFRLKYPRISAVKKIINYFRFLWFRIVLFRRWPFLRTAEIFMCDHMDFSWLIALKCKYNLLEDGSGCYRDFTMWSVMSWFRFLLTNIFYYPFPNASWGQNSNCRRVYLAHDLPKGLKRKYNDIQRIDLHELWRMATEEKRCFILNCFGMTTEVMSEIESCSTILLTQPFSEFKLCTESEKIEIYDYIIKKYNLKDVLIKTHPSERTDYKMEFGEKMHVFNHKIPMELLSFLVSRVECVITVSSSSIAVFDRSDIQKIWVGVEPFPMLMKTVGHVDPPSNI